MSQKIQNQTIIYLIIILFHSCYYLHNSNQLEKITELEKIIDLDKKKMKECRTNEIEKIFNITRLNLDLLESKQLDSIAFSLIYYDYRNYIDCVTQMYEAYKELNQFSEVLTINNTQLKNIKSDYMNSDVKRNDLDQYLLEEINIIKVTSKTIDELVKTIDVTVTDFYKLNEKLENILN